MITIRIVVNSVHIGERNESTLMDWTKWYLYNVATMSNIIIQKARKEAVGFAKNVTSI